MNTSRLFGKVLVFILACGWNTAATLGAETRSTIAAHSINALGIDLLHQTPATNGNYLISPYSIESALAMTYAGADGITRTEMAKALHFPTNELDLHRSFATLREQFEIVAQRSAKQVVELKSRGFSRLDPVQINLANRLFVQSGYEFNEPFLELLKANYQASLEMLNFSGPLGPVTERINGWVEQQTQHRIKNLIPAGGLNAETRLVLVNAVYLKAPWQSAFDIHLTRARPFNLSGNESVDVPTMSQLQNCGYTKAKGFTAVSLNYLNPDLRFLILLPDQTNGLDALEARLSPALLAQCTLLPTHELYLVIPKFKLQPPASQIAGSLRMLGMRSAFDRLTANFQRMTRNKNLFIQEVYHQTFLQIDEEGTEGAAATAIDMGIGIHSDAIDVRVDHPFLFAVQHQPSGACLFLGRVTDPR